MIKYGHRRQRADEKETDLANTEQDMTQYNPMSEPDLGLKTASIPIGRLHYHKAKHREGKVLRRTDHEFSGSQLPVNQEARPRKTTRLLPPVRLSPTRTELWLRSRSSPPFSTIKNSRTSPPQAERELRTTTAVYSEISQKRVPLLVLILVLRVFGSGRTWLAIPELFVATRQRYAARVCP
jgi:hypothetical protein